MTLNTEAVERSRHALGDAHPDTLQQLKDLDSLVEEMRNSSLSADEIPSAQDIHDLMG